MKRITINIDGKEYPARETIGALKRFKDLTGKEATTIKPDSPTDLAIYLYCCVASASHHDKVEFDISLDDFLDSLTTEVIEAWTNSMTEEGEKQGKKTKAEEA